MSKFGNIKSTSQVEVAIRDVLQTWMHTYLGQTERDLGRAAGSMPRPRSWVRTSGAAREVPDQQVPRVIIRSPGISSFLHTGGEIHAWFVVGVAVMVRGRTADETRALAQDYTATLRRLLVQIPGVSDVISAVELEAEASDVLDTTRERTHAGGEVVLSVLVEGVADPYEGPGEFDLPEQPPAPAPDFGDWTPVSSTGVTVNNLTLDEEIEP